MEISNIPGLVPRSGAGKYQISKSKNFTLYIVILIFTSYILHLFSAPIYAVNPPEPCKDATSIKAGFGPCPSGLTDIENVFGNVISVMVGLGFIALLVVVIMAGFKYLRSGGEPKALQSAHQTFTWAILGILFMIIAWLTLVLIKNFTGLPVTVFDIKSLCSIDVGGVLTDICKKP